MRGWVIALLAVTALAAKDDQRLELMRKSQDAFDRVEHRLTPQLTDASACVQAQAAMLAVALPAEQAQLHYRKGYCELAAAAITHTGFPEAAADLDLGGDKILAWLARLHTAAQPAESRLGPEPAAPQSIFTDLSVPEQREAALWQGYLCWKQGELDTAARRVSGLTETGWPAFIAGLRSFQQGLYRDAVAQFRQTVETWTAVQRNQNPTFYERLAPPIDIPAALTQLGGAQLVTGDTASAIASLNKAIQIGPTQAREYYLRARAREISGQTEASLADYSLASRTAFADSEDLASGEAHLYRGILFYRRRDFKRAEDEFSSALNLAIPPVLEPDAAAWRHLAAVAGGSCTASRDYLERSLPTVSPFFPKDEARAAVAQCSAGHGGV